MLTRVGLLALLGVLFLAAPAMAAEEDAATDAVAVGAEEQPARAREPYDTWRSARTLPKP